MIKTKKYNNSYVIETQYYIQLFMIGQLASNEDNHIVFPITFPNNNYIVNSAYSVIDNGTPDNKTTIIKKMNNRIIVHRGLSTTADSNFEISITYFK